MKISQIKEAAQLAFASDVTLCLVGESGIAKTSIWKSIHKELGFDRAIVIRPALFADSADLVGLPDFVVLDGEKRTSFLSPDWLPLQNEKVLIVVDEINRIDKQVANAIFGLIEAESPTVGQYRLPQGCKVVATCNPPKKNYSGVLNIADSAWASRLCFVKICPTLEDYMAYGRETKEVSDGMLSFLAENPKFFGDGNTFEIDEFFGTNEKDRANHILHNLRSKTKVAKIYEKARDLNICNDVIFEMIRGIAGLEFTTAFMRFMNEYSKNIKLIDILKTTESTDKFDFSQISNISKILEDLKIYLEKNELSETELSNVVYFLEHCPVDIVYGFCLWIIPINKSLKSGQNFLEKLGNSEKIGEKFKGIKNEQ